MFLAALMKQISMRLFLKFLLVFLGVFTIVVLVQAQDQSGFISLDCGQHEDVSYSALETNINYISDAKFIDTGVSKKLGKFVLQQLTYVRSFPNGVRNCYKINVTSGTKYLIRASFYYGNYDNINQPPQFDLHLGANLWDTVTLFSNESDITTREIIYTSSQDYIQPCLVNTGNGIPFISAIELRPLNNTAYVIYASKSVLSLIKRYDLGNTDSEYRYSDDVYDRIWSPYELSSDWRKLSTSVKNVNLSGDWRGFKPPAIVMRTAVTPVNASAPLHFHWDADNVNDQFYVFMHLYDFEEREANATRAFNITVNDMYPEETPDVLKYREEYSIPTNYAIHIDRATRYQLSLFETKNSTLPPILNAIEIYKEKIFSQSETEQVDVAAITNIKNAYGVARNWQGDPCAPVNYMWEGLNCSVDGNNIPRIISLNLSSSGLTGKIASSISKLTMLQYLCLNEKCLNKLSHIFYSKAFNVGSTSNAGSGSSHNAYIYKLSQPLKFNI